MHLKLKKNLQTLYYSRISNDFVIMNKKVELATVSGDVILQVHNSVIKKKGWGGGNDFFKT